MGKRNHSYRRRNSSDKQVYLIRGGRRSGKTEELIKLVGQSIYDHRDPIVYCFNRDDARRLATRMRETLGDIATYVEYRTPLRNSRGSIPKEERNPKNTDIFIDELEGWDAYDQEHRDELLSIFNHKSLRAVAYTPSHLTFSSVLNEKLKKYKNWKEIRLSHGMNIDQIRGYSIGNIVVDEASHVDWSSVWQPGRVETSGALTEEMLTDTLERFRSPAFSYPEPVMYVNPAVLQALRAQSN